MSSTTSEDSFSYSRLYSDPRVLSLTFASFITTFSIFATSPALPGIVQEVGVSESQVGLLVSAYALPAVFLLPIFAILADTYGRLPLMIPSLLVFGVSGTAIGVVDSFQAILFLRFVQGIGGAAIMPIIITMLGDLYSGPEGAAVQGLRNSSHGLSSIVTPAIAGFLAGIAWNYPFFLYAIAFPAIILVYYFVPETLDREDKSIVLTEEIKEYARLIRVEITDMQIGLLLIGGFVQGFSYFAILTFVPLFAVESLGTSVFIAGTLLSVRGVTRVLIAPFSGMTLTYSSYRNIIVGSLVLSAIGTGVMGIAPSLIWLVALIALFGIGDAIFTPVHRDVLTLLASEERRAGVVSAMVILREVGITLAPISLGVVLAMTGFDILFYIAGGAYLVYAIGFFFLFSADT